MSLGRRGAPPWLMLVVATGCGRSGFEQLACRPGDGTPLCAFVDGDSDLPGDGGPTTNRNVDPTIIASTSYDGAQRFGGTGADQSWSVATDDTGTVFITGSFSATVDFGDGPRTSGGGADGFVASLDAAGALRWVKTFGSAGDDEGRGVVVDGGGTVTIVGSVSSSVDLGCGATGEIGSRDVLVARLTAAGACLSSAVYGSAGVSSTGQGLALGPAGDVAIAATIAGATDFGGGLVDYNGMNDAVAVRFDAGGAFVWARALGSTTNDYVAAIAVSTDGDVFMSGAFTGPLACDGGTLTPGPTGRDIFLVALDALGADDWCGGFSPDNSASATALATDTAGNVYLAGDFIGSLDLGGGALGNAGNTDAFIASFTPTGTHRWSLPIGGAVADHMVDIVVDADVILWLVGYFALTLDFGASQLVSNGSLQDVAILAMDLEGAPLRGWSFGGTAYDFAYGVALAGTSCLEVTGRTDADVDFGGGVLPEKGGADAFVLEVCW